MRLRCLVQVRPQLEGEVEGLNQEDLVQSVVLLELLVLSAQVVDVVPRELYRLLAVKVEELAILRPVLVDVRVPIQSELLDLEHLERPLLSLLVIDVDEDALKSAVCRGPEEVLDGEPRAEGLVHPADALVLEPQMYALHGDPQVLADDLGQPREERVALFSLLLLICLCVLGRGLGRGLQVLLLSSELFEKLLEFLLLQRVQEPVGEGFVVVGGCVANDVDVLDEYLDGLGHDLVPWHFDPDFLDVSGLHDNWRSKWRQELFKRCLLEDSVLFDDDAVPTVYLDVLLREVLQDVHEG